GADERPRSVQVYGSDPDVMGEMARRLSGEGVHHIDMNFGCPAPKITRHGGGSAIPLKPRLMARLVGAAVRGAGGVPVTVKVRKGIHDGLLTYLDAGRVAEEEGAAAIGLHARTAAQLYAGDADWAAFTARRRAARTCSASRAWRTSPPSSPGSSATSPSRRTRSAGAAARAATHRRSGCRTATSPRATTTPHRRRSRTRQAGTPRLRA